MTELEQMYLSAIRYALGRKTYIVKTTINFMIKQKLSTYCKNIMIKDIKRQEDYGMETDKEEWMKLLQHLEETNLDDYNECKNGKHFQYTI